MLKASSPLLGKQEAPPRERRRGGFFVLAAVSVCVAVFGAVGVVGAWKGKNGKLLASSFVEEMSLDFSLRNDYEDAHVGSEYSFVDETRFAEPQRDTTITILGSQALSR